MSANHKIFIDLICEISGKRTNWDLSIPIALGDFGTLNETGEFIVDGSIYSDAFRPHLNHTGLDVDLKKYPAKFTEFDQDYIVTSSGVKQGDLDSNQHPDIPGIASAPVKGTWEFRDGEHGALAILVASHQLSISTLVLSRILALTQLAGKHLVTTVWVCPAYLMYVSNKATRFLLPFAPKARGQRPWILKLELNGGRIESLHCYAEAVVSMVSPPSAISGGFRGGSWLKNILGSTFQLNEDDIVVFVIGPSGSGKSRFIRAVTQAPVLVGIGQSLRPSTGKVQAIRCELTEDARVALNAEGRRNIVFVDIPSYLTDPKENVRAERETNAWLKKAKSRSTRFGTIYMHRIELDPEIDVEYHIERQLDTFAATFPPDLAVRAFRQRLHCVFGHVDRVKESKLAYHMEKFQRQLDDLRPRPVHGSRPEWRTSIHPDLFDIHNADTRVAWDAVEALFSH